MEKLVSIIITTHNRCDQLIACLDSLTRMSYKNVEIIVVDNNSKDNTVSEISQRFPYVKVIQLKENKGAVLGRNTGMQHARGDYFCFIDSDIIVDEDLLTELVNLSESDESIGFVGPKIYYYRDPKRIWCAGVRINLLTSKTTYRGINEIDQGRYDQVRETDQIPSVWLVKREVVDKIGQMDPMYVMSYGESDWPMRAQRAGYRVMMCPSAVAYHDIEVPRNTWRNIMVRGTPYRTYYFARNRTIFMKKFTTKLQYLVFLLIFNSIFLLMYTGVYLKYRRSDLLKSYIKGYIDGLRIARRARRIR